MKNKKGEVLNCKCCKKECCIVVTISTSLFENWFFAHFSECVLAFFSMLHFVEQYIYIAGKMLFEKKLNLSYKLGENLFIANSLQIFLI